MQIFHLCINHKQVSIVCPCHLLREHSFLRRGGWGGEILGRVITFLPAQKERVSINLTQQRGGSLKFYCFSGKVTFLTKNIEVGLGDFTFMLIGIPPALSVF